MYVAKRPNFLRVDYIFDNDAFQQFEILRRNNKLFSVFQVMTVFSLIFFLLGTVESFCFYYFLKNVVWNLSGKNEKIQTFQISD